MLNRAFFPCFDTPAVKCTYSAHVEVRGLKLSKPALGIENFRSISSHFNCSVVNIHPVVRLQNSIIYKYFIFAKSHQPSTSSVSGNLCVLQDRLLVVAGTMQVASHAVLPANQKDTLSDKNLLSFLCCQVPDGFTAVMSANTWEKKGPNKFFFEMCHPIPSYLIALAIGDLVSAEVGPR